jgi:hypothetical protein
VAHGVRSNIDISLAARPDARNRSAKSYVRLGRGCADEGWLLDTRAVRARIMCRSSFVAIMHGPFSVSRLSRAS